MSNIEVILRSFGRFSTIGALILLYTLGWVITVVRLTDSNDEVWCSIVSAIWIIVHAFALLCLMIWSWF